MMKKLQEFDFISATLGEEAAEEVKEEYIDYIHQK